MIYNCEIEQYLILGLCIGWDADFATTAYRQQVEALAQHQVCWINVDFFFPIFYWYGLICSLLCLCS